ncbi:MAG: DivIVA domain-containing protein [Oscillospiraceae bacterium]|nr:DivIVA domain-containing protein [Oscillospiraceae bacterium]
MITSAQIREHKFELSSDGAYTAESVDNYMNELSAEFDSLYSENREIIKRLSVFAKKIEDYKRSEGVVADTLLTAQKSASQTIAGAADVVDKMLESAKGQGKKIIEAAHKEADSIKLDRDVIITEAQKTAQEIAKNAAENAQNIISAADEKAREITDKAQADADALMQEVKDNTDEYIKQANEENEAEISRRLDEAQNKLDESQTVLDNAKSEAENTVNEAKSEAELIKEEAENTVNEAKSEAELIKEEAENIRAEAQRILDESRAEAQKIISSANAQRDDIIKRAHEESTVVSSDENMTENDSADSGEHTEETPAEESELNHKNDAVETAVEVEAEKIGNINDEKDVEKIEEDESAYSDESGVYIEGISSDEDIIINDTDNTEDSAGVLESDENSEGFDEFFSDDWNDVNVIDNDVPAAVDSFTLDMNAFGDDDDVSESQSDSDKKTESETASEEKPDEAKTEESASDISDKTEDEPVNSVKRDTVNPFDATGSDNIDNENDVLSDFEIDFSIFEEDPDKEIKTADKKNEKKNSKKSKRSRRK